MQNKQRRSVNDDFSRWPQHVWPAPPLLDVSMLAVRAFESGEVRFLGMPLLRTVYNADERGWIFFEDQFAHLGNTLTANLTFQALNDFQAQVERTCR